LQHLQDPHPHVDRHRFVACPDPDWHQNGNPDPDWHQNGNPDPDLHLNDADLHHFIFRKVSE
jgi:hypothetical protein